MLEILGAAAAFGLSGGLSPGPLLALVIAETMGRGRSAGLAVAAAPLLTDGPIIATAIFLLGRIENSAPALGLVSVAGGALLATWGLTGLRGQQAPSVDAPRSARVWVSLGKGVAANLLNPSPYLFWLTIGAPLLLRAWDIHRVLAVVFLVVFYLGLVGSKSALAMIAARSREALNGRTYLWINRGLATVLLVYAAIFVRGGLQLLSSG